MSNSAFSFALLALSEASLLVAEFDGCSRADGQRMDETTPHTDALKWSKRSNRKCFSPKLAFRLLRAVSALASPPPLASPRHKGSKPREAPDRKNLGSQLELKSVCGQAQLDLHEGCSRAGLLNSFFTEASRETIFSVEVRGVLKVMHEALAETPLIECILGDVAVADHDVHTWRPDCLNSVMFSVSPDLPVEASTNACTA